MYKYSAGAYDYNLIYSIIFDFLYGIRSSKIVKHFCFFSFQTLRSFSFLFFCFPLAEDSSQLFTLSSFSSVSVDSKTLITIKVLAQLPIKLSPVNYPSWRHILPRSLLHGQNLSAYVDDIIFVPPKMILDEKAKTLISNPDYIHYFQ